MGDQPKAKRAPASPAGPGRTLGCLDPTTSRGSFSRLTGSQGPEGVPRPKPEFAPGVASLGTRVSRCSSPRSGPAFFAPSSCAGAPGLSGVPHPVPIGLPGQEPESPPQSPSRSGFQLGATSVSQRRLARRSVPSSLTLLCAPLSPARAFAATVLSLHSGRLRGNLAPPPLPGRSQSCQR